MLSRTRRRFAYHAWATARLADMLTDDDRHAEARRLLSHAVAADEVWLRRLNGRPSDDLPIWPERSAEAVRTSAQESVMDYRVYLSGRKTLDGTITYRNSKGTRFETGVADVLDHILLHGAYHRGQVAAALRAAGGDPPSTDYIVWERAGAPGA